jgi:deoxyribonuclease-4
LSPAQGPYFGLHLDTGRGFPAAVEAAIALGLEATQIFTGNPAAWKSRMADTDAARTFTDSLRAGGVRVAVSHANYLINLAGPDPKMYAKSCDALTEELRRGAAYGLDHVIVHVGSHRGAGRASGLERIVAAVEQSFAAIPAAGAPRLLLENSAGTGDNIGGRFEDLGELLRRLDSSRDRIGVCFDTCHAYASGYDLGGFEAGLKVIVDLQRCVGLDRIHVIHANDTQVPLGGKADRHWHLGEGNIGLDTFTLLLQHPTLGRLPFILETPGNEAVEGRRNLETLRSLL